MTQSLENEAQQLLHEQFVAIDLFRQADRTYSQQKQDTLNTRNTKINEFEQNFKANLEQISKMTEEISNNYRSADIAVTRLKMPEKLKDQTLAQLQPDYSQLQLNKFQSLKTAAADAGYLKQDINSQITRLTLLRASRRTAWIVAFSAIPILLLVGILVILNAGHVADLPQPKNATKLQFTSQDLANNPSQTLLSSAGLNDQQDVIVEAYISTDTIDTVFDYYNSAISSKSNFYKYVQPIVTNTNRKDLNYTPNSNKAEVEIRSLDSASDVNQLIQDFPKLKDQVSISDVNKSFILLIEGPTTKLN